MGSDLVGCIGCVYGSVDGLYKFPAASRVVDLLGRNVAFADNVVLLAA